MFSAVKQSDAKPVKKAYVTPKLVTHGDVATLTQKNFKRPRAYGNGPASDID